MVKVAVTHELAGKYRPLAPVVRELVLRPDAAL
jgi:hypothetical protein